MILKWWRAYFIATHFCVYVSDPLIQSPKVDSHVQIFIELTWMKVGSIFFLRNRKKYATNKTFRLKAKCVNFTDVKLMQCSNEMVALHKRTGSCIRRNVYYWIVALTSSRCLGGWIDEAKRKLNWYFDTEWNTVTHLQRLSWANERQQHQRWVY